MTRYNSAESEPLQSPSIPLNKGEAGPEPGRRARQRRGMFLRDRRAAGTALTAAIFTLMSLAGIAFASDHVWLVYQRDLLKAATDAASVAATKAMASLDPDLEKKEIGKNLHPIAVRYVLANIPEGYRQQAKDTLKVKIDHSRRKGWVKVSATADLGGAIFGSWLWGTMVSETKAKSETERIQGTTEVVLAIDITDSMNSRIAGNSASSIAIVRQAAGDMVNILTADADNSVAIGLVPWHARVRLEQTRLQQWEDKSWAVYQPPKPKPWEGCVIQRETSGQNPPGLSIALPRVEPFSMGFRYSFPTRDSPATGTPACGPITGDSAKVISPIRPLTTDIPAILRHIDGLEALGWYTHSAIGVVWGRRLLVPQWRRVWGDPKHPVHPKQYPSVQKVLILLTDGEDNAPNADSHLEKACTAAKANRIKIFTIAAVEPASIGSLEPKLRQCSSAADDPSGQYVFINEPTAENLKDAFQSIAQQLRRFRRCYECKPG